MPLLTRTYIKTALAYFALALSLGIALAFGAGEGFFPVYIHLFVFGWLTQLIFGVIHWMFPKYSTQLPRGHEWLAWITYASLTLIAMVSISHSPKGDALSLSKEIF